MMEWDSRMQNNHSVKILKAAIPFLDIEIGEKIDIEGLLRAIRPFSAGRERKMMDLFLQFFQMRHMMEMMQLVQAMQAMQEAQQGAQEGRDGMSPQGAGSDMMSVLKAMIPPEQQEMAESISAMMSMMQSQPEEQGEGVTDESVNL